MIEVPNIKKVKIKEVKESKKVKEIHAADKIVFTTCVNIAAILGASFVYHDIFAISIASVCFCNLILMRWLTK
jgi:hypothetical protein